MKLSLRFLEDARREFDDAVDWYESRKKGLGAKFIREVRRVLHRIIANPHRYPIASKQVRKAIVSGFPYLVLYKIEPNELLVVSVFHTSRDPQDWKDRID